MDELDLCRIADSISLTWAAALLCGERPSRIRQPSSGGDVRCWHLPKEPYSSVGDDDPAHRNFDAALHALVRAVEKGTLKAEKKHQKNVCIRIIDGRIFELFDGLDPSQTMVDVDDLKTWLSARGVKSGFFFPVSPSTPDYLDRGNPRRSPKLEAAIRAWQPAFRAARSISASKTRPFHPRSICRRAALDGVSRQSRSFWSIRLATVLRGLDRWRRPKSKRAGTRADAQLPRITVMTSLSRACRSSPR